jgi:hypothetical protein
MNNNITPKEYIHHLELSNKAIHKGNRMKLFKPIFILLLVISATLLIFPISALADTDGSEIQITDQPDQLILQLGPEWAGVEFELMTDMGLFPISVIVDHSGILRMDLGGSKVYVLSCIASPVTVPKPLQSEEPITAASQSSQVLSTELFSEPHITEFRPEDAEPELTTETTEQTVFGIPMLHLILFIVGTAIATGGLVTLKLLKYRKEDSKYDDDDDDDYE